MNSTLKAKENSYQIPKLFEQKSDRRFNMKIIVQFFFHKPGNKPTHLARYVHIVIADWLICQKPTSFPNSMLDHFTFKFIYAYNYQKNQSF